MSAIKLAVVSAGLGEPSSTRLLADRLAGATRDSLIEQGHDVRVDTVELRDVATEIAHNFVTGFPGHALREALETVTAADGLIAVTPVFTASYSGLFKSFFDVMENDALTGKPVLLAATGGTPRHSLVLEHAMRPMFAYLRALTAPTAVYAATDDWGAADDGSSSLPSLPGRIARAGREFSPMLFERGGAPRLVPPSGIPAVGDAELIPFEQQLAALRTEG